MMKNNWGEKIIEYIIKNEGCSSSEIFQIIKSSLSYSTVKRIIAGLTHKNFLITQGKGKGTRYFISPVYKVLVPVDETQYFSRESDERKIIKNYNFTLIPETLRKIQIFNKTEMGELKKLQGKFNRNISLLTKNEIKKELERLAIDLSWKSSQIEGNTYNLLETERLLNEKKTASGKTKEEAIMLLNHKEAIDFIIKNPDYLVPLSLSKIEDIHSILIKELSVDKNIRKRRVGITGTNYRPLDNEFQIREAMTEMCNLINEKKNIFEKALLILVLISYIQPFTDGNKRTARIVANALLIFQKYCPISFRTVDSIDYKKALLLFYEQNNIISFKKIFMEQFEFAVNTYF